MLYHKLQMVHKSVLEISQLASNISCTEKGAEAKIADAAKSLNAIATDHMTAAEPFLINILPEILLIAGHKQKFIRDDATTTIKTICENISGNSTSEVMSHLLAAAAQGQSWQTRVIALNIIADLANHAPEQLGILLPEIIPQLTEHMCDVKKEVKEAASVALHSACEVIGNRDIERMTEHIVRSITKPEEGIGARGEYRIPTIGKPPHRIISRQDQVQFLLGGLIVGGKVSLNRVGKVDRNYRFVTLIIPGTDPGGIDIFQCC